VKEKLKKLILILEKLNKLLFLELTDFYGIYFKDTGLNLNIAEFDFSKTKLSSFKISNLLINNPVIASPMAGISDSTYRIFAKHLGCSLTFSEMIASYGLIFKHKKSLEMTKLTEFERPCAIQIFGNDSNVLAEAAGMVEENADMIDINMGCPVPKVLKTKSGGYLLNEPDNIGKIIKKIKEKVKKPVSVKLRIGWDENKINILEIVKIVENEGADAVSIHGRTVKQGYSGKANYYYIKKVKSIIKIPVIASGDIDSFGKAKFVMEYTGCDGIMVGRAARGNPWIFLELLLGLLNFNKNSFHGNSFQDDKDISIKKLNKEYNNLFRFVNYDLENIKFSISNNLKIDYMILYLKFLILFKGEEKAVKEFRKILGWAFKGQKGISGFKDEFFKINTFKGALEILESLKLN
jgi:tRNA-dihydrouridine synthase B